MYSKSPKIRLIIVASLLFLATLGLSEAKPLDSSHNKRIYDNFVERLLADFRKAGFVVVIGGVKDTPLRTEEPVIETEITVIKVPDDFKKYFGELTLKNFFIQGEERLDGLFYIYLWVRYKGGVDHNIFTYKDNTIANFEEEIWKAKQELFNYLFGFGCEARYNGFTQQIGGRLIFTSSLFSADKSNNFSKHMREFLSSFYQELKVFGFRFTLVENPPVSEIRIFGFPKSISMLLPEPETKLLAIRSKINGAGESVDISVFDRQAKKFSTVSVIDLYSDKPVKELAMFSAKKIFLKFYTPDCLQYYGM